MRKIEYRGYTIESRDTAREHYLIVTGPREAWWDADTVEEAKADIDAEIANLEEDRS